MHDTSQKDFYREFPAGLPLGPIFAALPGAYVLFSSGFLILAVSDGFAAISHQGRDALLGKHVFEVFPDNPQLPNASGVQNLKASLEQVLSTGKAHQMPLQHYDIPDPKQAGGFLERYWQATNTPVLDKQGRVVCIIHHTEDVTQQVKDQQLLEQSQAGERAALVQAQLQKDRLERFLMEAPAIIVVHSGPGLVFEFINPRYQSVFPGRKLLGKPLLEGLPELAGTPIEQMVEHVYKTGETVYGNEVLIPLAPYEGAPLQNNYYNFIYQARRDEGGQIDGIMVFAFDVTAQVEARRKVEQSEQQVRALVEAAPFPIGVYVGPEFRIELANGAILKGWGKGPDVIGKRFAEVLPEFENQAVFEQLNQVLSTGQPLHLRNQQLEVVMDGVRQTFYYNYSFTPLRNTQGEVYGILNTAADVTDLVQARRRTEEAAAELRLLTAYAPAFLFRTNPAGRMIYLNEAFFEWTGLERTQLVALEEAWQVVHPEDRADIEPQMRTAVIEDRSWESRPYRMRRQDGQYRWVFSRTQPVVGPDGGLSGHNGLTLEIHDQVELQRQLQRTNVDLDTFIYTASHDLKAPILNVEGLMKVLARKVDQLRQQDEHLQGIFSMMEASVRRFKETIVDLTDIARIGKQLEGESEPVDVKEIIADILLDLDQQVKESGAVIEQDLEGCPSVLFPRKNLKSVVYNLLSNAIKYRSPVRTSHITLSCYKEGDYQVLLVQDNGLGMNTSNPEKIFGMFKRQHAHVEGSGVGLFIVKKIVENAGGKIEVESQVGIGSTFRVYFKG